MRVFLTVILPLLAPSLLYIAWMLMRPGPAPLPGGPQGGSGSGGRLARLAGDDVPWVALVATGAVLTAAATLAMYILQPSAGTNAVYTPPRYEGGRIIPGEMAPRDGGDR